MKCLLSWFLLIVIIAVLVSSCAKSDDSKTATTDNSSSSSVNCNNGCFVAVGYSGNIVRSSEMVRLGIIQLLHLQLLSKQSLSGTIPLWELVGLET